MLWTCLPLCHGSCLVRSVYKKLEFQITHWKQNPLYFDGKKMGGSTRILVVFTLFPAIPWRSGCPPDPSHHSGAIRSDGCALWESLWSTRRKTFWWSTKGWVVSNVEAKRKMEFGREVFHWILYHLTIFGFHVKKMSINFRGVEVKNLPGHQPFPINLELRTSVRRKQQHFDGLANRFDTYFC